jgi:hypothetical protein
MKFEELKIVERDGSSCVLNPCVSVGSGEDFEWAGEFCSECEGALPSEAVTRENLETINRIRSRYKQPPLE